MTVIAVTSVKHSPGATTLALALVAAWVGDPARAGLPAVLVEADPAGGDLAARVGLPREPGLATLAASARHPGSALDVAAHAQSLPAGGWLVAGPASPDSAEAAVATVALRLAPALRESGLAVVDCGRWAKGSEAEPILFMADVVLVIVRPDVAGVDHLCARLGSLRRLTPELLTIVAVGDRPYDAAAVATVTGCPVVVVASDPDGATGLTGVSRPAAVRRSRLVRSARPLLDAVAAITDPLVPA